MKAEDILNIIKEIKKDKSLLETVAPNSKLSDIIGFFFIIIFVFCGGIWYIASQFSSQETQVVQREKIDRVREVITNASPVDLEKNRMQAILEKELLGKELKELRLSINSKKEELSLLEKQIETKKELLQNDEAVKNELKEEVSKKVVEYLQNSNEEVKNESYREGYSEGEVDGILGGALLYHFLSN